MNKKLVNRIQELFFFRLSKQTNWGKNQVESIYKDAVNEALVEMMDSKENDNDDEIVGNPSFHHDRP